MGKMRNSLILLLTLLCICLLAFLPRFSGWVRDREMQEKVAYRDSTPVRLEIREDISVTGKLALLCRMDGTLEVPEALMGMTRQEAEQAAMDALASYVEAGLIPEFSVWHMDARPLLIRTADGADLAGLIWSVSILGDDEGVLNMSLDLDDATGKLLRVNFTFEFWNPTDLSGSRSRLEELYFAGLELEEYEKYATDELENRYIGEEVRGVLYRIPDAAYGEASLEIVVHRYGFYVETPLV